MKRLAFALVLAVLASVPRLTASGPLGIYGIIERVVFVPNETSAERIQVWGAFAYFDAVGYPNLTISPVQRGYLYFRLPTATEGAAGTHAAIVKQLQDALK